MKASSVSFCFDIYLIILGRVAIEDFVHSLAVYYLGAHLVVVVCSIERLGLRLCKIGIGSGSGRIKDAC